jgi:hypothetical protein
MEATELVAFDILNPILRSRGAIQEKARQLYSDETFQAGMWDIFQGEPSGQIALKTLQDAFERIVKLEKRLKELERLLEKK